MNIEEVHKIVSKIRRTLFKNSNSYSIGVLKSHFRGTGLHFKEHQVYVHGDDVRFLDWKLLAKTSHPYIKTFEEERNVEIVVVIDASPTMFIGWNNISKLQASVELCCLLYLLAKETGDRVHAIVMADEILDVPPGSGEKGIVGLVSVLQKKHLLDKNGRVNLSYEHRDKVGMEGKLTAIMKHLRNRREVILFSDFNDFMDSRLLERIIYQSNVHCIKVEAPIDRADRTPYTLFVRDRVKTVRGKFKKIKIDDSPLAKGMLGKHFKKVKVDERYLEDFISEML